MNSHFGSGRPEVLSYRWAWRARQAGEWEREVAREGRGGEGTIMFRRGRGGSTFIFLLVAPRLPSAFSPPWSSPSLLCPFLFMSFGFRASIFFTSFPLCSLSLPTHLFHSTPTGPSDLPPRLGRRRLRLGRVAPHVRGGHARAAAVQLHLGERRGRGRRARLARGGVARARGRGAAPIRHGGGPAWGEGGGNGRRGRIARGDRDGRGVCVHAGDGRGGGGFLPGAVGALRAGCVGPAILDLHNTYCILTCAARQATSSRTGACSRRSCRCSRPRARGGLGISGYRAIIIMGGRGGAFVVCFSAFSVWAACFRSCASVSSYLTFPFDHPPT